MWDNEMDIFDESKLTGEEKDDFKHCKSSDFKYLIYHVTGEKYTFTQENNINNDNAVS